MNKEAQTAMKNHISEETAGPRLMILGGSNCQLHGVEQARGQGIYTLLIDYTSNPPAKALASQHVQISTYDVEGCIEVGKAYKITGVMTMGTDQPVYTAACVSRALGLPTLISPEDAFGVTNKKRMKEILTRASIPTAPYRIVPKDMELKELMGLAPPYVLKPLDSQGQRGVFKLDTACMVQSHLEAALSFSRCSEALVEEFYESHEVTVSGWVKEGNLHILTVTDRLHCPDNVHIGVCCGHRFPTVHMDRYQEIADISRRTSRAFGLKEGPFYLQLLIGKQGIYVNELAARIGGAFEDVLIPEITGFDILGAAMDCALGRELSQAVPEGFRPDESHVSAVVLLLFCRPGEIGYITPLRELLALPGVLDAGYNYKVGESIPVMENATARFGHGVILGDKENIKERVDAFYHCLSVRTGDGEEMVQRFQL